MAKPSAYDIPAWKRRLAMFFRRPEVELIVAALVLLSVILTLLEMSWSSPADDGSPDLQRVILVNDSISLLFMVELSLRFLASPSRRRFLREFWLDIVAVLPLFHVFGSLPAMRMLRLVRVLRMFGVTTRLASHFPYIVRRGAMEFMVATGLIVLTVVFATGGMLFFEGTGDIGGRTAFERAFWFSVYSLFASEPIPEPPTTLGGRLVAVSVRFMGLTVFAMFTGTVSAFMVERLRGEKRIVHWDELRDHLIICGWNSKAEIIVQEYRAAPSTRTMPIAVIALTDKGAPVLPPNVGRDVHFLNDDFTRVAALETAGIHRARTCIVLSDTSGVRSEQDADARTILAALTVEKLNPAVYTCAELLNASYGSHLKMGRVNDYVVSGEYSAYLLAQAAMNRGLMSVFNELMTCRHGNEFYRLPLPQRWLGKSFFEVLLELKKEHNAILVAVHPSQGALVINPPDYVFQAGDEMVVIAPEEIHL
jgi:voltage-gated potassium channel